MNKYFPQNKLLLEDQLKSFLQMELRFLTTPCIIIESEKLGSKLFQTVKKLKSLTLNKCGHEKNPLTGSMCIKSIVKQNHYVVATQDRDLQEALRRKVGVALLYLHKNVPIIDEPSDATKKFLSQNSHSSTTKNELEKITEMKKKVGLITEPPNKVFKKKKRAAGPNPLSCKRKSQNSDEKLTTIKDKVIKKKKKKPNLVLVKS